MSWKRILKILHVKYQSQRSSESEWTICVLWLVRINQQYSLFTKFHLIEAEKTRIIFINSLLFDLSLFQFSPYLMSEIFSQRPHSTFVWICISWNKKKSTVVVMDSDFNKCWMKKKMRERKTRNRKSEMHLLNANHIHAYAWTRKAHMICYWFIVAKSKMVCEKIYGNI